MLLIAGAAGIPVAVLSAARVAICSAWRTLYALIRSAVVA